MVSHNLAVGGAIGLVKMEIYSNLSRDLKKTRD